MFWLLAIVIVVTLSMIAFAAFSCTISVFLQWQKPGTCIETGIADELHNLWSEMLTAILALLVARPPPPPGPKNDDDHRLH